MINRISCRSFIKYHPTIGHIYVPNINVRIIHENGGYFIRTNSTSFRSDFDFIEKKNKDKLRILLFGDSFTAGDGVDNKSRFSDLLSKMLNGVEVYNFGLSHSGTDQQYLIFREYTKKMEFDILMICPFVENIRRNVSNALPNLTHDGQFFIRPKPYFDLANGELRLKNVPVPRVNLFSNDIAAEKVANNFMFPLNVLYRIKTKYFPSLHVNELFCKVFRRKIDLYPEYNDTNNFEWILMRTILENWIKESSSKTILIVPIPWHLFIEEKMVYYTGGYQRRFKELENMSGVKIIDPLNSLRNHSRNEIDNFTYNKDKHFTKEGHKALAEAILPDLVKAVKA